METKDLKMQVFVISYETDDSTYKLYLLGKDQADAMTYLKMRVGGLKGYRMNNFESREEIHMVTPQLIDMLTPTKPVAEVVHKLVCPWCEADHYETNHALKMHICKAHATANKDNAKKKDK
jgi:hypothetical protein